MLRTGGEEVAKRGTALQMEILDMLVQGKNRHEIAETLSCSLQTVNDVKGDEAFKRQYYERCSAQIEELVPLAIRRLKVILENDGAQSSVHVAAVREVLDRSHLKELLDATEKEIKITVNYE